MGFCFLNEGICTGIMSDAKTVMHEGVPVVRDSVPVMRDSVSVMRDGVLVVRDSVSVKRDGVPVKHDYVSVMHDDVPAICDGHRMSKHRTYLACIEATRYQSSKVFGQQGIGQQGTMHRGIGATRYRGRKVSYSKVPGSEVLGMICRPRCLVC